MQPPRAYFKVFGLQRTGTNLMRALLSHNFHVEYLQEAETGWKHGPMRLPAGMWKGQPVRLVLCIKNPYAWVWSCYRFFRNSVGGDPTMAPQFQRDPSMSFEEFLLTANYSFETPIHRWNQMNRLWLNTLPADRTIIVRQEDQLHDQVPVLHEAQRKLHLTRRWPDLRPIDQRVDVDVAFCGQMNRHYYLDRRYMAAYTPLLLRHVNQLIDPKLMTQFGYATESWTLEERQIGPLKLIVRPCTADATEACQAAGDPLRLVKIKRRGDDVPVIVDAGAGIGAWVLFVKGLWPQARVLAYEPCPDKLRLLRTNTRKLRDVQVVQAPFTESSRSRIDPTSPCQEQGNCCLVRESHIAPSESVATVSLEEILNETFQVHLLKLPPYPDTFGRVLGPLMTSGKIDRIHWICAQLTAPPDEATVKLLSQTHGVETWTTPAGEFIMAGRLP